VVCPQPQSCSGEVDSSELLISNDSIEWDISAIKNEESYCNWHISIDDLLSQYDKQRNQLTLKIVAINCEVVLTSKRDRSVIEFASTKTETKTTTVTYEPIPFLEVKYRNLHLIATAPNEIGSP